MTLNDLGLMKNSFSIKNSEKGRFTSECPVSLRESSIRNFLVLFLSKAFKVKQFPHKAHGSWLVFNPVFQGQFMVRDTLCPPLYEYDSCPKPLPSFCAVSFIESPRILQKKLTVTRPDKRQFSRGQLGRSSNAKAAQNSKMLWRDQQPKD